MKHYPLSKPDSPLIASLPLQDVSIDASESPVEQAGQIPINVSEHEECESYQAKVEDQDRLGLDQDQSESIGSRLLFLFSFLFGCGSFSFGMVGVYEFMKENRKPPLFYIIVSVMLCFSLTLRVPYIWTKVLARNAASILAIGWWVHTIWAIVAAFRGEPSGYYWT